MGQGLGQQHLVEAGGAGGPVPCLGEQAEERLVSEEGRGVGLFAGRGGVKRAAQLERAGDGMGEVPVRQRAGQVGGGPDRGEVEAPQGGRAERGQDGGHVRGPDHWRGGGEPVQQAGAHLGAAVTTSTAGTVSGRVGALNRIRSVDERCVRCTVCMGSGCRVTAVPGAHGTSPSRTSHRWHRLRYHCLPRGSSAGGQGEPRIACRSTVSPGGCRGLLSNWAVVLRRLGRFRNGSPKNRRILTTNRN